MAREVLFSNEVFISLFAELLLLIFNTIALFGAIKIIKHWDFSSTSDGQYHLEKVSYLISLIITVSLLFNIFLLPYFAYTIEQLSTIVPGAMCGAGVIAANSYGNPLLLLKILILFFVGLWLIINREDLKATNYPYTKKKFAFFIFIFALMLTSSLLEVAYFTHISLEKPVACCSVIFGFSGSNGIPLGLNVPMLLALFYLFFILNLLFIWQKKPLPLALSSLLFLYVAYEAVIHFFGTYIYQLPTHICPFCMLERDYYYIGYLLWGVLFLSIFFGISNAILKPILHKEVASFYRLTWITQLFFVLITAAYVVIYLLQNKVWL